MKWLQINTLQKRLMLFLVLPATLLLLAGGVIGFSYAREVMLDQWRERVVLQLERAARYIDMRLGRPLEFIELFNNTGLDENGMDYRDWIVRQLEANEGVAWVDIQIEGSEPYTYSNQLMQSEKFNGGRGRDIAKFHRGVLSMVTSPKHEESLGINMVSLISTLMDKNDKIVGRLVVAVRFDYLIADIISLGWWQSHVAGIVNDEGRYIVQTEVSDRLHERLGQTQDSLEKSILKRLGENGGTQFGPEHPPEIVAGFYRLKTAPWTIVMFASGQEILQPIIRFRNYFFAGWAVFALLLLVIIRVNVSYIIGPIRYLSKSAEAVSRGQYDDLVAFRSHDEIGQLIDNYNRMVDGLKERDLIRNTFSRYVDPKVARKLLSQPEFTRIGGIKREVAILMADIRAFTPMAERLEPDAVIRLLNHYFSFMIDITHRHEGIIVDFVGDGLLAFFEPMEAAIEGAVCQAYQCAHDMLEQMTALNETLGSESLPAIKIGLGLNAGEVIVGNIGSDRRTKYGIVGAEVNLTQRVQAQAGPQEIIATASFFRYMDCRPVIAREFYKKVKGVKTSVQLYSIN